MKNKLLRVKEKLDVLANDYVKSKDSEIVNEIYITIKNLYKNDIEVIARSVEGDCWEVEACFDDSFMKAIETFKGGSFTNYFSKILKNSRLDLKKGNRRRNNRFILEKESELESSDIYNTLLEYLSSDVSYSLDDEIEKPKEELQKEIIDYLIHNANDETSTNIVNEWLNDNIEENNILKITNRLGISYSTGWRKIKKLSNYYDSKAEKKFGNIEEYI